MLKNVLPVNSAISSFLQTTILR